MTTAGVARVILATVAMTLGGCATSPDARMLAAGPVSIKFIEGTPAVRDHRAEFREVFCATMHADGLVSGDDADCGRWLWRLPDEPAKGERDAVQAPPTAGLAVFLVTGAFAECVGAAARPYTGGSARLQAGGALVETIVVGGRSGTASNARQIAEAIERAQLDDDQTVIVIGYSKGALDTLRFLVDFPAVAARVDAVVSVASPIFGTVIADVADPAIAAVLAKLPFEKCPAGDGQVIKSLSPVAATQWLAANTLPTGVRYYSLAGFTTREHVARALVTPWKFLSRIDPRNDGQVIAADAVIPGATLLGYANADHWGIAQSTEYAHSIFVARADPAPYPINQLFLSIVQYVARDVAIHRPASNL